MMSVRFIFFSICIVLMHLTLDIPSIGVSHTPIWVLLSMCNGKLFVMVIF